MIPADVPLSIMLVWLFVFGAVVGSFLNVCIYRIPKHDKLWDQLTGLNNPPSTCPFCKNRILAIDNIPILGWLILRGRCRFCRHWIPIRYALIEFLNGMLWVVLYLAIVPAGYHAKIEWSCLYSGLGALANPRLDHAGLVWLVNAQYVYFLILAEALLVATFIDLDLMVIPDGVTVPGTIAGLVGGFILGAPTFWPVWFFDQTEMNGMQILLPSYLQWMLALPEQIPWLVAHPHWHGLISSIVGMLIGAGTVLLVRVLGHWAFGREAMGGGDVTLMAMIGSFIGWQPGFLVFFLLAPVIALIVTICKFVARQIQTMLRSGPNAGELSPWLRPDHEIPFGPYLSIGALLVVFLWKSRISRFETFFNRGPFLLAMIVMMALVFFPLLVLIRTIKHRLGFADSWDDEPEETWTSGDQLTFYANKETRDQRGLPPQSPWPGIASGQGNAHSNRWSGR